MDNILTIDRLRSLLDYNPESGIFTWVFARTGVTVGAVAGKLNHDGYIHIMVDQKYYSGHRLAWFFVTGEWPVDDIDHKDCDRSNNRFLNLRNATQSQNNANIRPKSGSSSGFKGVTLHKDTGKWQAQIKKDGKNYYLGLFNTPHDAHLAYVASAKTLHGEFSRAA